MTTEAAAAEPAAPAPSVTDEAKAALHAVRAKASDPAPAEPAKAEPAAEEKSEPAPYRARIDTLAEKAARLREENERKAQEKADRDRYSPAAIEKARTEAVQELIAKIKADPIGTLKDQLDLVQLLNVMTEHAITPGAAKRQAEEGGIKAELEEIKAKIKADEDAKAAAKQAEDAKQAADKWSEWSGSQTTHKRLARQKPHVRLALAEGLAQDYRSRGVDLTTVTFDDLAADIEAYLGEIDTGQEAQPAATAAQTDPSTGSSAGKRPALTLSSDLTTESTGAKEALTVEEEALRALREVRSNAGKR